MTERLYYEDAHQRAFTARVASCAPGKHGFDVVLDRTCFYPEGGGQAGDTGLLGGVRVTDTHERDGEVVHYCESPLEVGAEVAGEIDWDARFERMQLHSGEHILSGLAHKHFGYENVGFHMSAECMTIDFRGELDWAQLMDIERRANEAVRADLPVRAWFPEPDELARLSYRSKLELTEDVRIVEIGDIDRCACCAPHVAHTGEIGVIKIFTCERHRGGVRVTLLCGMDALDDYRRRQDSAAEISQLLSVPRGEIAPAVRRVLDEQARLKERFAETSRELVTARAAAQSFTDGNICIFDSMLDDIALRELVNLLKEKCTGFAAAFSGGGAGRGELYLFRGQAAGEPVVQAAGYSGAQEKDRRASAVQSGAACRRHGGAPAARVRGEEHRAAVPLRGRNVHAGA